MPTVEEKKFDKIAYNNQFNAKAYDRINLTIPKGKRDVIKAYAESLGESVNGYIWRLIQEDMTKGS
ncbi:MAG: Arc family DNA-binding protein [Oscillospiraceae bacterium]|nr:Arc family DNA-binding protein [Oscillospiraceae bacterium]